MIELTQIGSHLIFAGIGLFIIGLIQGALIPVVKNSRMALSGHTTAVQCGMALAIFGVIWSLVDLPVFFGILVAYGSIIGFFLIWLGITAASVTGASRALPIAGAGYAADYRSEVTVTFLVRSGSILSLLACSGLLLGLLPLLR